MGTTIHMGVYKGIWTYGGVYGDEFHHLLDSNSWGTVAVHLPPHHWATRPISVVSHERDY